MATERPRTLGELRASGYRMESVKDEMRRNLIAKIRAGEPLFPDILGYEETVVPQVQNAILSRHDMLFLGLRGQAKTRMLRQLVHLLDDAMPIVAGSEVNDHPVRPDLEGGPRQGRRAWATPRPIDWVGREAALPREARHARRDDRRPDRRDRHDQARRGALPLERADHALRPDPPHQPRDLLHQRAARPLAQDPGRPVQRAGRARRPDPRLSRSGSNLDLCMVFSANPEDYTNRGRIVTPLKDRIGSVVRTHYPLTRELGIAISDQNAWLDRDGGRLAIPLYIKEIVEEIVAAGADVAARQPAVGRLGPDVDRQPGERRLQRRAAGPAQRRGAGSCPRVSDLAHVAASSRGKLELTMTEDDGHEDKLIGRIVDEAVKNVFAQHLDAREFRAGGRLLRVGQGRRGRRHARRPGRSSTGSRRSPASASGPRSSPAKLLPDLTDADARDAATASAAEFILEGLHVHNKLNKTVKAGRDVVRALIGRARESDADRPAPTDEALRCRSSNTPSGTARRSSSPSRPTRPSTSSPSTCSSTATRSSATSTTSTRTTSPTSSS